MRNGLWYRYHALFGGLLKARLQTQTPDLVPVLHHRTDQWYEQNDYPLDAAHHALATNDYEPASNTQALMATARENAAEYYYEGCHAFEQMDRHMPKVIETHHPRVCEIGQGRGGVH